MVKETATAIDAGFKPIGYSNFVRTNPLSDRFKVNRFHHVEFWCTDATNTARCFSWGLGMPIVAKSDISTGNVTHASYLLRSGDLRFLFTAPYSPSISATDGQSAASIPTFSYDACCSFSAKHGLGVRAIGIEVEDAEVAFRNSVAHGGRPSAEPVVLDNHAVLAEVHLYGDVVLRYVSYKKESASGVDGGDASWFLPNFEKMDESSSPPLDYGIRRLDHAVGNVEELGPAVSYVKGFTGFHEFAEFTAEDVGTSESGLNSVVLANNEEMVLLPMNEPVYGTKRKSQIQTYLEHNEGAGVQHLALMSEDIFRTLREMRKRSTIGAFEFMPSPPPTYYRNLKNRAGDVLSDEQIKQCEELGILVDRDDQGTLLQIFTKPLGDRPTFFIEIIQRVGCMFKDDTGKEYQKGGCGGFGKGNFSELFKSIEEYEKTLETKRIVKTGTELKPLVSRRGKENAGSSTSHHAIIMPEHEPNPEWVTSVAEKIKQEPKKLSRSAGKSSCCIFRVPQSLVEINDKAYHPHIVSIGPYHYGKLQLQTVQEHKGRFLGEARARAEKHGVGFNEFFKAVAADEERIRECYAETIEYSSREFVEMMMLDGCFIVELFCIVGRIVETNQDDPLFNVPWMFFSLMRDLLRLENQIPFFVLQSLYKVSILSSGKQDLPSLTKLALKFFNYGIQRPDEVLSSCNELEGNHLLDLFRSTLIPPTLIPPPQDQSGIASEFLQFIPSASKLRKAGIRFKLSNSPASFLDIKFSNGGFLEIPHLTVDDNITSLLLNCIAYEQCYGHCSNHITSYISFMNCLINTPMDAGFLSDRRVIENYFGTDKEVQKFFCNVGKEVMFDIQKSYLAKVFQNVNEYYRNNWHVSWAGFKHTYFNSPWSFMSALAALLILIFTINQLLCCLRIFPSSSSTLAFHERY